MRHLALKPDCRSLEDRTSLSIGGFNIGPVHVPSLGTILNGGQAPPANVSTVGNPQPPSLPLTEYINIQNRTPVKISVTINWRAPFATAPYTVVIPAATAAGNGFHPFYLNEKTDKILYNPTITFTVIGGGSSLPVTLTATSSTHHAYVFQGRTYTSNYYHFGLVPNGNGSQSVMLFRD